MREITYTEAVLEAFREAGWLGDEAVHEGDGSG